MSQQNLESVLKAAGQSGPDAPQFAIGAYVYPVVPRRVPQLDGRAARLARERRAVRPVAPHGRADREGPGCAEADLVHHDQQLQQLRRQQGEADGAVSYDGYVIGDGILFYLDKDELLFVGRAPR
jgi:hypothetical protein